MQKIVKRALALKIAECIKSTKYEKQGYLRTMINGELSGAISMAFMVDEIDCAQRACLDSLQIRLEFATTDYSYLV